MDMARRDEETDKSREHHERHHARLHQFHVITDTRDAGLDAGKGSAHRIRDSVSYWWNGGGAGSVHSSVVAPGPHGLAPAGILRRKACARPKKNTSVAKPEMNDPIEETKFQPANASG